jgi:flagellar biosynthesis activator protein FlaF
MYQFAYTEILDDSGSQARLQERAAFDRVLVLLRRAQECGPSSRQAIEALYVLRQLWTLLTDDLVSTENLLPDNLKARLISIGIWMMKEADRIAEGKEDSLEAVIAINSIVRDGLK